MGAWTHIRPRIPVWAAGLGASLPLVIILILATYLRWHGLAWDDGFLFHPDERQILLVASHIDLPHSLSQFISPSSPLNPHFFSYGSLPFYLLRLLGPIAPHSTVSGPWSDDTLAGWIIFARAISGLFDLGTVLFTFALGKRLFGYLVGMAAASFVAVTVLNIQLSHFYAVDTLLTFLVLATIYFALRLAEQPTTFWKVGCGVAFGLAFATKVSALPLIFPIAFAVWRGRWISTPDGDGVREQVQIGGSSKQIALEMWRRINRPLTEICVIAGVMFVLTQPYAVLDWYSFGRDVIKEALVARGWLDFPYTRQFSTDLPYLYQIDQTAIWAMGLPLGVVAWGGAALFLVQFWLKRSWRGAFLLSWGLVYFILVGAQYVKYPRYLLPLLPILYVMAAQAIRSLRLWRSTLAIGFTFVLTVTILYSLAFVSIYGREHPWITVSRWIYANLPPGSTVAIEEWDDALPVQAQVGGITHRATEFKSTVLSLYGPDDEAKVTSISDSLARSDLVIIASQRAYGSLARMPDRYPLTGRYYDKLFGGRLGFKLVKIGANFPQVGNIIIADNPRSGLPLPELALDFKSGGIIWDWGFADESLTVYDHPQPLLFLKSRQFSSRQIHDLILE